VSRREPIGQYATYVVRAWDKEGLADRIKKKIDPYPADDIIDIKVGVDFQFFFPARRNWAIIIVKGHDAPLD
jgi:hypothetical protein